MLSIKATAVVNVERSSLLSTPQLDYGNKRNLRSANQGRFSKPLPATGYCLVFARECENSQLIIQRDELFKVKKEDKDVEYSRSESSILNMGNINFSGKSEQEFDKSETENEQAVDDQVLSSILSKFKHANLTYAMRYSRDLKQKFIFVFVSIDDKYLKEWADFHDIDIIIDAEEAVRLGRNYGQAFLLAERYAKLHFYHF